MHEDMINHHFAMSSEFGFKLTTVMVSGCYSVLHAGHVQFFSDAKRLGHRLIVVIASDKTVKELKNHDVLPEDDRLAVIRNLSMVDLAEIGTGRTAVFNFEPELIKYRPDIYAVTEDERHIAEKERFCKHHGVQFVVLPKTKATGNSSTSILNQIKTPKQVPLRVDLFGGWLDLYPRQGGYIGSVTITPMVSIDHWEYQLQAGLGGSAAWSILNGKNAYETEKEINKVGWQDPAIINETGLCVFKSGDKPKLVMKRNVELLQGMMALYYTGAEHKTQDLAKLPRDYTSLEKASVIGYTAIKENDLGSLMIAVNRTYEVQLKEGMPELPDFGEVAKKYAGSGWGGYAVYFFDNRDEAVKKYNLKAIEPYMEQR